MAQPAAAAVEDDEEGEVVEEGGQAEAVRLLACLA